MTRKLYIRTFGCQMNEYDSDKMAEVLAQSEGAVLTDRIEEADIVLFNTCSVREKAQEKVFSDLGRVRALKLEKPSMVVGVGAHAQVTPGRPEPQEARLLHVRCGRVYKLGLCLALEGPISVQNSHSTA